MKRHEQCNATAAEALRLMCDDASAHLGRPVGGRVWLLPAWYAVAHHRDRHLLTSLTQLALKSVGRPRMALAASVFGPVPVRSSISWGIGKGLPGYVTFHETSFSALQHDRDWPDISVMSKRQWECLDQHITLGRKLSEARKLRSMYGTVIGVPVVHPASQAKLGCVTLHTKQGDPISDDEACEVAVLMTRETTELGNKVADCLGIHGRF